MCSWKRLALLAAVCVLAAGTSNAATIKFRSGDGDGAIGTPDPYVMVLPGPQGGFTSLTASDFAAARAGNPAVIVYEASWDIPLSTDSAARPINVSGIRQNSNEPSGLYAIRIDNEYGYATNATLDLCYSVDDYLGRRSGPGYSTVDTAAVYLNDKPLTATTGEMAPPYASEYNGKECELHFTGLTLQAGENWIYINATNTGFQGAVIFSGMLTFTPVPEPVSLSLLAVGVAGLLSRRRR